MPAATDSPAITPTTAAPGGFGGSANFTRSAILNLLGEGVPMVVSLAALRVLVHRLHENRFAILTLAWTVMAYFSIADLGISRAMTQAIARRLGAGDTRRASTIVWTGLAAIPLLGLLGMGALMLLTPALVRWLLVPPELAGEARVTFYVLAVSLPMLVTTAGLRAILEACGRFGLLAGVKCTTGTLVLVAPLAVLPFTLYMPAIVGAAVLVRAGGTCLHAAACWAALRNVLHRPSIDRAAVGELFRFGRWLTLDNLLTPVLVYGDRWLLPRRTSFAALPYYATPVDLVLRLLFIPFAIAGVLFPALARDLAGEMPATGVTLDRGARLLAAVLFPVALVMAGLAPEAIQVWLGSVWAVESARVLQLAAMGLFLGGMAVIPSALVQAAGRPELPFFFHCVEIPIQLGLVWLLAGRWGVDGAAAAFVVRVMVEFCALSVAARWLMKEAGATRAIARMVGGTFGGAGVIGVFLLVGSLQLRLLLLAVILPGFAVLAWWKLIHRGEAAWVWGRFRRAPGVESAAVEGGVA